MTQLHKYETAHTPDHPCGVILVTAKTPKIKGQAQNTQTPRVLGHSVTQPTNLFNALTSLKVFVLSRAHSPTDTHRK